MIPEIEIRVAKEQNSVRDVLRKYGIWVNKSGFCECIFHDGDREPSMKIYDDKFHCFGCGADGDVITLVKHLENCYAKEAIEILLGRPVGTMTRRERSLAIMKRNDRIKRKEKLQAELKAINKRIGIVRAIRDNAAKRNPMGWIHARAIHEFNQLCYKQEKIVGGLYGR